MSVNASKGLLKPDSFLITAGLEYIYADMVLTEIGKPYYSPKKDDVQSVNSQESTERAI